MSCRNNDMVHNLIHSRHIKHLFSSAQLVIEHTQSSKENGTTNSCKCIDPTLIWLTHTGSYHGWPYYAAWHVPDFSVHGSFE